MIISRSPLRISFVGGGTDINWFYKNYSGAVVTTSINKYIYITVNKKFDDKIRASYSKTEIVDRVTDLNHELIRESLQLLKLDGGIEITSISDVPSEGTGLGSSSSYTVGLLNALYAYKGRSASAELLAKNSCKIEIDILKKPIGKQDQYIAAYGGLQYMQFNKDGSVYVDHVICKKKTKIQLEENLMMLYTGLTRSADKILNDQKNCVINNKRKVEKMVTMTSLAKDMKKALEKDDLTSFGEILDANWQLKKELSEEISSPIIDNWYIKAKKAGAIGGKICGAGAGGFLLLYAHRKKHLQIRSVLKGLRQIPFSFEPQGSKIIYICD